MRRIYSLLAITLLGLSALTACNSAEQRNSTAGPIASRTLATATPADGVRRVTVTELQDLLARNEAVVFDVRNQESYDQAHIQGAKLMPVADTLKHIDQLPKDKLIVTYCS
jgi:3-mercaptopyruvate sulfurtransferase SseA